MRADSSLVPSPLPADLVPWGGGMGDGGGVRIRMAMWGMGLGVGGVQGWRGGRGEGSVTAEYSTPAKHAALGTHSGCLRSLFSE